VRNPTTVRLLTLAAKMGCVRKPRKPWPSTPHIHRSYDRPARDLKPPPSMSQAASRSAFVPWLDLELDVTHPTKASARPRVAVTGELIVHLKRRNLTPRELVEDRRAMDLRGEPSGFFE